MESNLVILQEHIEIIFDDLESLGYIDSRSRYYAQSKERCYKTCTHFYPILEFLPISKDSEKYLLYTSYLWSWTYFYDDALDYSVGTFHRTRANIISLHLLMKYNDWLKDNYSKEIYSIYHSYFSQYANYLISEKEWDNFESYSESYGSLSTVINKAIICLFPLELLKTETIKTDCIMELFIKYFSFLLIADDITDIEDDLNSKCLTYAIIKYYKLNGSLPNMESNLATVKSELMNDLYAIVNQIDYLKCNENLDIFIIEKDISNILSFLTTKVIKL